MATNSTSLVDQFKSLLGWMNDNSNNSMFRIGSNFGGGMSNPNFGGEVKPVQTVTPMSAANPDAYVNSLMPTINANRDMQTNAAMARLGKSGMGGMGTPVYSAVGRAFANAGNEMNSQLLKAKMDAWNKNADLSQEANMFNANAANTATADELNRRFSAWQTGMNTASGNYGQNLSAITNLLGLQQSGDLSKMGMMGDLAKSAAPWGMLDVDPEEAARRAGSLWSQFNNWL